MHRQCGLINPKKIGPRLINQKRSPGNKVPVCNLVILNQTNQQKVIRCYSVRPLKIYTFDLFLLAKYMLLLFYLKLKSILHFHYDNTVSTLIFCKLKAYSYETFKVSTVTDSQYYSICCMYLCSLLTFHSLAKTNKF